MQTTKLKTLDAIPYGHTNEALEQGYQTGIVKEKNGIVLVTRCCNCGQYENVSITKRFLKKLFNL